MSRIYPSADSVVGRTPLVELRNIKREYKLKANILAKLEYLNPAGSIKDRVARQMMDDFEAQGLLKSGSVIIEPTSGNTGIGLAMLAAARGYRLIIVMPDTMSVERRQIIRAFGAELVLTEGKEGMKGAIKKAEELHSQIKDSIIAGQFYNPSNPKAHYLSTGPEILADTDAQVAALVAGVGTGGTISGTGKFLKENIPSIKIVAVEPKSSAVLSGGEAGPHAIQGIGAGFIPDNLDTSIYDEVITVSNDEAYFCSAEACKKEGLMVGISAGAALSAAIKLAKREELSGKNIVVILPDTGDRYLSTPLFEK